MWSRFAVRFWPGRLENNVSNRAIGSPYSWRLSVFIHIHLCWEDDSFEQWEITKARHTIDRYARFVKRFLDRNFNQGNPIHQNSLTLPWWEEVSLRLSRLLSFSVFDHSLSDFSTLIDRLEKVWLIEIERVQRVDLNMCGTLCDMCGTPRSGQVNFSRSYTAHKNSLNWRIKITELRCEHGRESEAAPRRLFDRPRNSALYRSFEWFLVRVQFETRQNGKITRLELLRMDFSRKHGAMAVNRPEWK